MLSSNYKELILHILTGAALLSLFSIPQKMALGADPFVLKGFVIPVLFGGVSGAIIGYGYRKIKALNRQLSERIEAMEKILPICANCKKIRLPESDYKQQKNWVEVESYFNHTSGARFSHSICPECMQKIYPDIK